MTGARSGCSESVRQRSCEELTGKPGALGRFERGFSGGNVVNLVSAGLFEALDRGAKVGQRLSEL
ncbi:MAG: hypothetical protein ACK4IT_02655 [Thioalkalivibrionaceae bacterium]